MSIEHRPHRHGVARLLFSGAKKALEIQTFMTIEFGPFKGRITEACLVADSMTFEDTTIRQETVVITNE